MAESRVAQRSRPTLTIQGFRHSFPDGRSLFLPGELQLSGGDCALVSGSTGSGKTSLLYAIAGLLPGVTEGVDKGDAGVGFAFQNPATQLFFSNVEEEIGFAPRNRGLSQASVQATVGECLDAVGLAGWQERNIDGLSMGEKHRVALAAAWSSEPTLLLLDEPFAQLDSGGADRLRRFLESYLRRGGTVVVSEHDPEKLAGIANRSLDLPHANLPVPSRAVPPDHASTAPVDGRIDIDIHELDITAPDGGRALLRNLTWRVTGGERVHIRGPNGSGKSTLLRTLVGLHPSDCRRIEVAGCKPSPAALAGIVAFLHQDPDSQLFAASVREEVAFAAARLPPARRPRHGWVDSLIHSLGLAHLAERSPLSLSFGEKHLVALAAALACRPRVVAMDEPFTGLDKERIAALYEFLADYSRAFGSTLLITSHNPPPDPAWATRRFVMDHGRFLEDL
ncbi:MAG: ABC transporter ATP-binding protein [Arenicellales bacterium]